MNQIDELIELKYKQLSELYNGNIPKHINERISFFKQLDLEYKDNYIEKEKDKLFSSKNINKSWRGFWLKATGIDEFLYMFYITYAKTNQQKTDLNLEREFINSHPNEKFIPYSISIINEDLKER